MSVDLGAENRPHTIEVVAVDVTGAEGRGSVTTSPVPLAEQFEVELQQLYVTVTNDGSRVLDLTEAEFRVFDEGQQQELITFTHGDLPFTAVLLIDASASMHGAKLEAARAGARAFLDGMRELDQGKVIVFSDVIQSSTPFSYSPDELAAGLIGATGFGGTALNDHLYAAMKMLESRQGRRVVVVLSDGMDSHSVLRMEQVAERARHSQSLLYWIRLERKADQAAGGRLSSSWRSSEDYANQLSGLEQVVASSGGRTVAARTPQQIRPVFLEILEELRSQYALGYYPQGSRNDGAWRSVEVEVTRSGTHVRTHDGYVDY
jgi:Ca-activated chloride channel family protein